MKVTIVWKSLRDNNIDKIFEDYDQAKLYAIDKFGFWADQYINEYEVEER